MRVSPGLAAAGAVAVLLVSTSASAQQQPPGGYQPPPQGYQQAPPRYQQAPQGYQQPGYGQPPPRYQQPPPGYYGYSEPPPPPPPKKPESSGFKRPEMSIRVDPFNWLLEGRLGFELESSVWKFISVEVVPVFVVNSTPPTFNYFNGWKDNLSQESNGLGPLAGASIDAGFWLDGKPFKGNVLRVILTNYGYTYKTKDGAGTIDQVSHTDRQLYGYFGTHMKWGFFTIASGIGLGVELNRQKRCFTGPTPSSATSSCSKSGLDVALDRSVTQYVDMNGPLYPAYLMARLSLGVVF